MPYKIIKKKQLGTSSKLFEMDIYAPLIAKKAFAGNFVLIRINEKGERIPLTIADYNREKGRLLENQLYYFLIKKKVMRF